MKLIQVRADELLDLLNEHDCWAGTKDPADAAEWRSKYSDLRHEAEQALSKDAGWPGIPCAQLPDGSGCFTASFPLPKDHWIYSPGKAPLPILTHRLRQEVTDAVKYALAAATMHGSDMDFDPDAVVQNVIYALCGPFRTPNRTR